MARRIRVPLAEVQKNEESRLEQDGAIHVPIEGCLEGITRRLRANIRAPRRPGISRGSHGVWQEITGIRQRVLTEHPKGVTSVIPRRAMPLLRPRSADDSTSNSWLVATLYAEWRCRSAIKDIIPFPLCRFRVGRYILHGLSCCQYNYACGVCTPLPSPDRLLRHGGQGPPLPEAGGIKKHGRASKGVWRTGLPESDTRAAS